MRSIYLNVHIIKIQCLTTWKANMAEEGLLRGRASLSTGPLRLEESMWVNADVLCQCRLLCSRWLAVPISHFLPRGTRHSTKANGWKANLSWESWCMSLIPGHGRQRQVDLCKFQDSLVYIVSHRLTKVTLLQNKTKNQLPTKDHKGADNLSWVLHSLWIIR